MRSFAAEFLGVAGFTIFGSLAFGQDFGPRQAYSGWAARTSTEMVMVTQPGGSLPKAGQTSASTGTQASSAKVYEDGCSCASPSGRHCLTDCFPANHCLDDYCPNPFPRQCWPPYPSFYRCVPAGDCAGPGCRDRSADNLTWWFIPKPRALREAIGWRP